MSKEFIIGMRVRVNDNGSMDILGTDVEMEEEECSDFRELVVCKKNELTELGKIMVYKPDFKSSVMKDVDLANRLFKPDSIYLAEKNVIKHPMTGDILHKGIFNNLEEMIDYFNVKKPIPPWCFSPYVRVVFEKHHKLIIQQLFNRECYKNVDVQSIFEKIDDIQNGILPDNADQIAQEFFNQDQKAARHPEPPKSFA